MKAARVLAVIAAVCLFAPAARGQEDAKIPRRVYFVPPAAESLKSLPPEQASLAGSIPYLLFSAVTNLRPVVLVDEPGRAQSTVGIEFRPAADGGLQVNVSVREGENLQKEEGFSFRPAAPDELGPRIRKAAEAIAPLMTEVPPEVSVESRLQEERRNRIIQEGTFADALAKPFQLTLWTLGFLQFVTADLPSENFASRFNPPDPVRLALDLGWYRSPNFGYLASLYLAYNDTMYFGSWDTPSGDDKDILNFTSTRNLLSLAGLGVSYRTLGKLSGEFNILLYLGAVTFEAREPINYIYDDGVLVMDEGRSKTFFFTFLSFQPCLAFNFSERFSVKTRVSLNIDPRIMGGGDFQSYPYNRYSNFLFLYLGEIGVSYRF